MDCDGTAQGYITSLVEEQEKNHLRARPIKPIGGASVPKVILSLTILYSCALAFSAHAARQDSLSFRTQTVFQTSAEETTGAAAKSGVNHKSSSAARSSTSEAKQTLAKADAEPSKSEFVFKDQSGKTVSVPVIDQFRKDRIVRPIAKVDPRLDPSLSRAASIADERANAHSKSRCWRYVKQALLASGAVSSYPKTSLAKEAGDELVRDFGFKKLPIRDPYSAPVGSVLVYYKGRNRPGHVEIRTKNGFVSDFRSKDACKSALVGVYAKK